ncbi:MAG TPA: dTMP kinase [Burkholderiaceae bacterium]|nr:dTMP kinase [Burkholderiaceae bacterium]
MTERGRFITFEGIDGSGKSTHLAAVVHSLRTRNVTTVLTREPGGTPLGESLRELILNQPMTRETETMLMFAARAEHLAMIIRPALAAGQWVLCDRFTDATYAYQAGGRGIDERAVAELEHWVHPDLQPDLTILFDVAPEVAARRLAQARCADRFEAEPIAFFGAVRAMYLQRAAATPARFFVIDGAQAPDAVRDQLEHLMRQWNG